jgi:hypothetical protein
LQRGSGGVSSSSRLQLRQAQRKDPRAKRAVAARVGRKCRRTGDVTRRQSTKAKVDGGCRTVGDACTLASGTGSSAWSDAKHRRPAHKHPPRSQASAITHIFDTSGGPCICIEPAPPTSSPERACRMPSITISRNRLQSVP